MNVKRLAHICIASTDLAATQRFYCDGLGLEKAFDFIKQGKLVGMYFRLCDGNYIETFQVDAVDPATRAPIMHMCIEVEDIDKIRAQLTGLGFQVTEKTLGPDHSWQAWVTDPAGVRIEFHQYTSKSCQCTGANCLLD